MIAPLIQPMLRLLVAAVLVGAALPAQAEDGTSEGAQVDVDRAGVEAMLAEWEAQLEQVSALVEVQDTRLMALVDQRDATADAADRAALSTLIDQQSDSLNRLEDLQFRLEDAIAEARALLAALPEERAE